LKIEDGKKDVKNKQVLNFGSSGSKCRILFTLSYLVGNPAFSRW